MRARNTTAIVRSAVIFCWCLLGSLAAAQDWDPKPQRDSDAGGDKTRVPIVFVHGQSGAGEQFERQAMHFTSNGYPASWIVAFDYSTAGGFGRGRGAAATTPTPAPADGATPVSIADALDKFIDDVIKRTGHAKVNLIGHSRGTFESTTYMNDAKRAAKIAYYVSIGGSGAHNVNGIPSLGVGSAGDMIARSARATNGGVTVELDDQDHVMVATSDESFEAIYKFLNDGQAPKTMKIESQTDPLIGGFVKAYMTNKPLPGAIVEVWEVAKETGKRTKDMPLVTLIATEAGQWGPFRAQPGKYYEFVVSDKSLQRPRHVYREPFKHDDNLVYFRIASTAEGSSPAPTDRNPEVLTDKNAVYNVRHQNGALTPGKMSLKINGTEVCTEALTPKASTVVGLYVVDGDKDGKTSLARIPGSEWFGSFVGSVDMFLPVDPPGHVEFRLGSRVLNVPNWKGSEVGHVNVVFDDCN